MVFRAVSGERKELELYSNEKRFLDGGPPKLIVDLLEVVAIHVLNGKRNEFYVEVSDGGMCLFETKSPDESTDWVSCLNAVLFAKGPNGGELCVCVCVCVCVCTCVCDVGCMCVCQLLVRQDVLRERACKMWRRILVIYHHNDIPFTLRTQYHEPRTAARTL